MDTFRLACMALPWLKSQHVQGEFGADRVLGIDGYVTPGACRMACLAGRA